MHTVLKGMRAKKLKKQGDANEMCRECDFVFELCVNPERFCEILKIYIKVENFIILGCHSIRFYRHISVVKKLLGQYLYIRINYIY